MTPINVSLSASAIGGALDDVVSFSMAMITNNISILVMLACLVLAMGFCQWLLRRILLGRESRHGIMQRDEYVQTAIFNYQQSLETADDLSRLRQEVRRVGSDF